MKRFFVPIGLLVFFALCLVPSGNAQQGIQVSYASAPAQLALSWTFTASSPSTNAFTVNGLRYFQLFFVPAGTVSACAISLDSSTGSGFSTGGILSSATIGSCASATIYANTTATTPTLIGQLTPTITGTGTVTVILLGYVNNPGAAGSSSASIISPVDGSGYVEVNCKMGCSGGNANGQATMAGSAPVVLASNQSAVSTTDAADATAASAVPAKGFYAMANNAGNAIGLTTDSLGDLHIVIENAIAATGSTAATSSLLEGGVYNSSAPSPSSGQQEPLQLDSSANLKVNVANTPSVAQSGTWNVGQTGGPWTINWTQVASVALGAPSAYGTSPGAVNVLGVNAFITNTPAVSQSGTWNSRTQDGAGNALTSNSSTYTSKFALDVNLLGADGTAFGAAGVVDSNVKNVGGSAVATAATGVQKVGAVGNAGAALDAAAGASAAANSVQAGAVYNSSAPSPSAGQQEPLQLDANANLKVDIVDENGSAIVVDPCQANAGSQATISLTASGQVITGTSGKQTYICAIDIVTATAQNIALVEGTGTTCGSSTAGMAGGSTAATGWNFGANGGLVKGVGSNWVYKTATTADNVCLLLSSTGQTSGEIRYVQQ
jgi:hypothetical protein